MAKARDIPGLDPDMPFGAAAAATVRVRAQELIDHGDGVLDTADIERVHAMRVASRRLRAVLEIHAACFPKQQFGPVLRDVKALADALGARRDPDVQLASIQAFAAELAEADRPGIEVFAQELRDEQARGNAVLAAALEEIERNDLLGRLMVLADAAEGVE
jgi:CHAD domain-containing protein